MKKKLMLLLLISGMLAGCKAVTEEKTVSGQEAVKQNNSVFLKEPAADTDDAEILQKDAQMTGSEQENIIVLTDDRKRQIEGALYSGEFSVDPILLEEMTVYLNELEIGYEGYYIGSDRVDMTLADGTTLLFLKTENQDMLPFGYELIMVNDVFNQWNFQENYYHAYDVCDDIYYYPELSERVWSEEDYSGFSRTELSIARNELFAKHGRIFSDPFLRAVFEVKSWYEPAVTAQEFDSRQKEFLTDIEEENLQTIIEIEKLYGWRGKNPQEKEVKVLLSGSQIDLDGNGVKEQIIYEMADYGWEGATDGAGEIKLRVKAAEGESIISLDKDDGYMFHEKCFITSMDGIHYYLIVSDYGLSADYVSLLFDYENGKLSQAGRMYAYATRLKVYEDRILAPTETCHLQCQPVDYVYVPKNGEFVHQPSEYYEYRGNIVTALVDYSLYAQKEDKNPSIILKKGDKVKILGGDLKEWVLLEKADTKECGWLKVSYDTADVWISPEEGISYYEAFEGLYFYG